GAGQQRPALGETPPGLRVPVEVLHPVALVAPQRAAHAERVAEEVLVTAAMLALAIRVRAGGDFECAPGERAGPAPAQVEPAVVVFEVDHAAGAERIALGADRHRQVLLDRALAAIGHRLEPMAITERL